MKKIFSHGGNIVLLGFALAVITMGALCAWIMTNKIDMVNDNYYARELNFQQELDAAANSSAYKDSISVTKRSDSLIVQLPPSLSSNLDSGFVNFYRPGDALLDKKIKLDANTSGVYVISAKQFAGGLYKPEVAFSSGGKNFYKRFSLFL